MSKFIKDAEYDEIVIESNYINGSTWAEAVSQRIGARHIAYPLGEHFVIENNGIKEFLIFKHKRRELVGITQYSLSQLFASFYTISDEHSYWLPASCNNVEADVDNPYLHSIDKNKYDFIIGCLSRLTKPFVKPALKDFCRYANSHKDKKFLLLFMGDSTADPSQADIINQLVQLETKNVELIITGYLYPVPTKLLELCDAFFTSAGSGWVCAHSGVPTIVYDGHDYQPIGLLGRTTSNCLFRSPEETPASFETLLNDILFEKKFPVLEPSYQENRPNFDTHVDFLNKTEKKIQYFNMEKLHIESAKERILSIIGGKGYKCLMFVKELFK